MRSAPGDDVVNNPSLDADVHRAYVAWDQCHAAICGLRPAYDDALRAYEADGGTEPLELHTQLRATQAECDQLFFKFLRAAEDRTRARYI